MPNASSVRPTKPRTSCRRSSSRCSTSISACVRNAALDHLHARMKNRFYDINSKETVRLAAEENAPGDEQAMIEQIAAIYRRIEALPEQGRRIFKMICIEHKSYVETARLLSLSLHTVKTHMSRSFKALRKISMFFLTLF